MKIDPSYDVATRTWFITSPIKTEATTIPALLEKLPPGTEVLNYHPNGFEVRWTEKWGNAPEAARIPCVREKSFRIGRPRAKNPTPSPPVYAPSLTDPDAKPKKRPRPTGHGAASIWDTSHKDIYEQVMDLWAKGMKGNKIAKIVGLDRLTVSSRIIQYARIKEDPRAVRRAFPVRQ